MTTKMQTQTEDAAETEKVDDIEAIVPESSDVIQIGGVSSRVRRIKTREFIALMRVLTAGLGPALGTVRLDLSSEQAIVADLGGLMLLAIPNATEEAFVFLATICEPVNPDEKAALARYLHDDPELDEMLDIFERVAVQEAGDLRSLAGKAQAMWTRIAPMFQKPKTG